jgi:hypothetical protein
MFVYLRQTMVILFLDKSELHTYLSLEFFGVSVLEAVKAGCWPLCPNKLVFPELFPSECLYNTEGQLVKKLRYFARYPGKSISQK